MAFFLTQGGANLYKVDTATGTATALTLPTGVTLSTTLKPRFAMLNQWVVMTNSPSKNLAIDPEGLVYVLVPQQPTNAPYVGSGGGTGLTGAYRYRVTYVIKNAEGETLFESPFSPVSASYTAANVMIALTFIPVSVDDIPTGAVGITFARRIYRTLASGTAYYRISDLDGNVATSLTEAESDASVALLPALDTSLESPPGTMPGTMKLKLITEWKSRLWAVADDALLVDQVFVSDTNKIYSWPDSVIAAPTGQDKDGITALAPRRNQLGLLKRSGLWQISGSSSSTGVSINNIAVQQIAFNSAGCVSPDTVCVIRDKVYYLGRDGVYEWSDDGVQNLTNSTAAPWFKTDTYFNRTRFANAFARYNEERHSYELHLAAAGSSTEDRWVTLNLNTMTWYGPHKTATFTPSAAIGLIDANGLPMCLVGGTNGIIYTANRTTFTDGASDAIDFDCTGAWHTGSDGEQAPDLEHYYGELSMLTKVESAGTLTITPTVGRLGSSAQATIAHTLTTGRELLRRMGDGPLMKLRFQQATNAQGVSIYGYEIPDVFVNGRR